MQWTKTLDSKLNKDYLVRYFLETGKGFYDFSDAKLVTGVKIQFVFNFLHVKFTLFENY